MQFDISFDNCLKEKGLNLKQILGQVILKLAPSYVSITQAHWNF